MILLNGHSLTPARKIPLESMPLQLKERESTATITPADMTGIQINSWMQDDTEPGRGIVWRVKSIQQAYATDTPTVQLEHMISTLKDTLLFGEIKLAQITGNPKATTCTAEQAVRFILSKQRDWVLGSFGYSVSNPYKFDGDTLFDALETVSNSLAGAWWSYDFSVYPFRLNINMGTVREETEMRAGRNLKTINRTIDKGGMFTRFYPTGKDDLQLPGKYVDLHTDLYGVIEKGETDNDIDTVSELQRWATERLALHAEPTVTIDVEGMELVESTGESLDRMTLGAYCRVPLPEYGTTISERIVALNYPDKIKQPEVVRVTMANNRQDVTKIIADAIKKSGKGARTSSKKGKEDRAWFEDTNDHVAMCAKGIVGVDAQGNPNWVRLSQIIVNENGIETSVRGVQKGLVIAETAIKQNEDAITLEARRATSAESSLSGQITVEAGKISQVVTAVGKDGKVTAASICLAINQSGESSATINASKIYLLGQTIANTITADYIGSKIASLSSVDVKSLTSERGGVSVYSVGTTSFTQGGVSCYVPHGIWALQIVQNGNTYTLQRQRFADDGWVDVGSFSRAATKIIGAWSGGNFTVSADENGSSPPISTFVEGGTESWSGGLGTIPIMYTNNGGANYYPTGGYAYAHVNKADINIPTNWTSSSTDPDADVKVSLNSNYKYHKVTISVHGRTKTLRVYLMT